MVRFDPTRPDFSPYGFSCVRWTPTTMPRCDRHNEIELNLLDSGRLVYLMGGQKVTVPAGRLTVFWAGIPHQIIEFEGLTEYFVLTIPLAWFLQWRLPDHLTQPILHGQMIVEPDEGVWRRIGRDSRPGAKTCGWARRSTATSACWRSKPDCGGWR
jgi:AraC family transcriptional regulator, melibiose operon regulatory protein